MRVIPRCWRLLRDVELTGNLPPVTPDGFSGYTHRPAELMEEIAEAELALEDLVGVEGMPLAARDLQSRLVDSACLAGRAGYGAGRRTRS